MEATTRELNQQTAKVLERVAHGETVTVTKNGRPVAVVRPYGSQDPLIYPFRTDPMGRDNNIPTFSGNPDFAERVDDHLVGFGSDE